MKVYVIDDLISEILACVRRHRLAPGAYARWSFGEDRDRGINPYGCADAANILYTIGCFTRDAAEREAEIKALQGLQDPETGLYREETHHPIHTTAHCSAALELYDQAPLFPCYALQRYRKREDLYELLAAGIRWATHPWRDSHIGAGILPCLVNTGAVDLRWKEWYFSWLWEHSDPESGFFCCGEKKAPLYEYMAGGFHYIFNHEAERRPLRYPERIVDSCLSLIEAGLSGVPGAKRLALACGFIDIDVVYCLSRAMRQTPHRFAEGKQALERLAERYLAMLYALDPESDPSFDDLHMLFGAVCCLAELQSALPGKLLTAKPLRLVLDRRPFI